VETPRLRLRPFTPDDGDNLFRLYSDAEVMRYVGKGARTRAEADAALNSTLAHWNQHGFGIWAVEGRCDGHFLGRCGLRYFQDTPDVELSYTFGKETWGKGMGTEAAGASIRFGFVDLGLERILAIAIPDNVGSWRVMEKIGMRREGTGVYFGIEHVRYVISRQDYQPV
jgi:ribosomal-protein-alanine N-acetyltransferase